MRAEMRVAGEVFDVAFSPDGTRLATGSTYNLVKLWDARTTDHLETFQDNRTWVTSIAFSPDGTRLAVGGRDGAIEIRDGGLERTEKGGLSILVLRRMRRRSVGCGQERTHTPVMPANKRAVYLSADLHKALQAKAAAADLTVAELVSKAARTYLADAADEATFGRQEPAVSFRAARGKKRGGTKAGKKVARKGSGKRGG